MASFFLKSTAPQGKRPAPIIPWVQCTAKTAGKGQKESTVVDHSRQVAGMASALSAAWGLSERIPNIASLAAVHDVGKISPGFQSKIGKMEAIPGLETNHAMIGESAVSAFLNAISSVPTPAAIVGAHHGSRSAIPPLDDREGGMGGPEWAAERRAFITAMVNEFGPLPDQISTDWIPVATGLIVLADWLASGFPESRPEQVIASLGLDRQIANWQGFESAFRFSPNELQQKALETRLDASGLYLIDAPMGAGKTEAALALAGRFLGERVARGVYLALPTMATANALLDRARRFLQALGMDGARLLHSQSWMVPTAGGELAPGGSWFIPAKRGLVYPFSVGTVDQALLAAMRVRHFGLRQAGLSGRVLIIDEVHTFDTYTGTLVTELIRTARRIGCPTIVLSATLSKSQRKAITAGGSIHLKAPNDGSGRQIGISLNDFSPTQIAQAAFDAANRGAVVGVLANTVSRAQECFRQIKAIAKDVFPVGLLHSRIVAADRSKRERHWLELLGKKGKRPAGAILVGTQVLEQSLDVDFDFLISELAPIDLILQRMGRLWRHPREARPLSNPTVSLITAQLDGSETAESLIEMVGRDAASIYPPHLLWRTFNRLKNCDHITLPMDIEPLIEAIYEIDNDDPGFVKELAAEAAEQAEKLKSLALAASTDAVALPVGDDDDAPTRLGGIQTLPAVIATSLSDRTVGLITGQTVTIDQNLPRRSAGSLAALLAHATVSVPRRLLPKAVAPPPWLESVAYNTILLVRSADGRLQAMEQPTRLGYDDELGLFVLTI